MKIYKNIVCTIFVNVNIALNVHSYDENYSFILEFVKRCIICGSLNYKMQDIYYHIVITPVLLSLKQERLSLS